MAMQPLALSLLGVEPPRRRGGRESGRTEGNGYEARPARSSRRATSYYNPFQTNCTTSNDDPPSYSTAMKQRAVQKRSLDGGREILPKYTCTTAAEGRVLLNIESVSPLHGVAASEWREVYLVLRGTLLSFHKPKDSGPGRLLRNYTLQHAEVGLAPDIQHVTLEPRTRFAHMIPSAARRRAWLKDPDLFEPVRQHSMRLRVETDQIVLASADEEQIHALVHAVSAGIDISCAIDERSIPRQCTVPRRRRRHRQQQPANLDDPTLLAEQERILQDMYPSFASQTDSNPRLELSRTTTTITATSTADLLPTPTREEDEIDLSAMREEADADAQPPQPTRPTYLRTTTDTSIATFDGLYVTSPDNFAPDTGKWQPRHTRTVAQTQRYVRRCMPLLLAESPRASDVLIANGKRVRVNLRMEMLEEWELQPPSYRSHGFGEGEEERPGSVEAGEGAAQASTSVLGVEGEDQITQATAGEGSLELTKVASGRGTDKGMRRPSREVGAARKGQERAEPPADEVHGIVFCF